MGFLSCQICAPARERLEKADVEDVDVSVGQRTHFLLIIHSSVIIRIGLNEHLGSSVSQIVTVSS